MASVRMHAHEVVNIQVVTSTSMPAPIRRAPNSKVHDREFEFEAGVHAGTVAGSMCAHMHAYARTCIGTLVPIAAIG